jgi:hypothetical protein
MAENALTRKLGPLPTWGWVAIAAGVIGGYAYIERKQSSSATSGTQAASTEPPYVFQLYPPDGNDDSTSSTPAKKTGSREVAVPDVIGEEYPAGSAKVTKAGLRAQRSSPFVGKVTRESPSAGTHVKRGTMVTLSGKPWPQSQQGKGGPLPKKPAPKRPVPKKKAKSHPGTAG